MSIRIDTTELIPGSIVIGNVGLGVIGSLIPSAGTNGPAYTYNDLTLPADNNVEIMGRITTPPVNDTLFAWEDTSFTASGPNGVDSFQYQLYADGVAIGSPATVTLVIGAGNVSPGPAQLVLQGYAPTISRTTHANTDVSPGPAVLTIAGYVPFIDQSNSPNIRPGPANLVVTGYAPLIVVGNPRVVSPSPAVLTLTGYAPQIRQSGPQVVSPSPAHLTIQGYAPAIARTTGGFGGSPFVYKNSNSFEMDMDVQGGTVQSIQFSRDGATWYPLGITQGLVHLNVGDFLQVYFTSTPQFLVIPR